MHYLVSLSKYGTKSNLGIESDPKKKLQSYHRGNSISDRPGRVLEVPWRNGIKASWSRFFFNFCQIFGTCIWWFFKWSVLKVKVLQNFLKIIEYTKNLLKLKNVLFNWRGYKPIFQLDPISGTRSAPKLPTPIIIHKQ